VFKLQLKMSGMFFLGRSIEADANTKRLRFANADGDAILQMQTTTQNSRICTSLSHKSHAFSD